MGEYVREKSVEDRQQTCKSADYDVLALVNIWG